MKKGKVAVISAKGNSMFPILQNGDLVEYFQTPYSKIKLNDIILVYIDTQLVTHRVIYKSGNRYITRGDSNLYADKVFSKDRILAKVSRFKRNSRWHSIQKIYLTQSALYLSEIQKVESVFNIHNLPHVFLKGVLISLRYQNSIPNRIYADCDILVSRDDETKICKLFKVLGYSLHSRISKPEVNFVKLVQGVNVVFDVHFEPVFLMTEIVGMKELYPPILLKQLGRKILSGREKCKIKGFSYTLCNRTDQILYLTLHIFHHNFTDSLRYQLLDSIIKKRSSLDNSVQGKLSHKSMWEELQQTIRDYQLEGYVYGVFLLLKKYYNTPFPKSFLLDIRPRSYTLFFIRYIINHVEIFNQESRTYAGIKRFIIIFLLSPNKLSKKINIIFDPEVVKKISMIVLAFWSRGYNHLKNTTNKWRSDLKIYTHKKLS